jgi:hypothetical protein
MKTTTANSAKNTGSRRAPGKSAADHTALDRRYGQIGISAVAAAVRYQGEAKNPAYAPAPAGRYQDDAAFE